MSRREARTLLRIGNRKLQHAFDEAQDAGFIILRKLSSFNWKNGAGKGEARQWEITTERCDGRPAKRLYKSKTRFRHREPFGSDTGNRSPSKNPVNAPSGSDNGNRYGPFRVVSGS